MIGRIYDLTDGVMHYYGATRGILTYRLSKHKYDSKTEIERKSYKYFNTIGWDKVQIVLIEESEFENLDALHKRESEYISRHINDENCLNCNISYTGLSINEYQRIKQKEYCDAKRESYRIYQRNYQRLYRQKLKNAGEIIP
jgi:hypothetical protein